MCKHSIVDTTGHRLVLLSLAPTSNYCQFQLQTYRGVVIKKRDCALINRLWPLGGKQQLRLNFPPFASKLWSVAFKWCQVNFLLWTLFNSQRSCLIRNWGRSKYQTYWVTEQKFHRNFQFVTRRARRERVGVTFTTTHNYFSHCFRPGRFVRRGV